jgi:hypothetical protein|tara:strand:+ start:1729 stop:1920 length:192 start_codon:yes stop_codon:yes gene_type:complete
MTKEKKKPTRMFAPFRNNEEMNARMENLLNKIPKTYKADLWLWIGQYESTWVEGFSDNKKGVE